MTIRVVTVLEVPVFSAGASLGIFASEIFPFVLPVHGESVNYAAIGIWNRPRQWCRHA
jgi:hypothetical protein